MKKVIDTAEFKDTENIVSTRLRTNPFTDASKAKKDNSPLNFNALRKVSLSVRKSATYRWRRKVLSKSSSSTSDFFQ